MFLLYPFSLLYKAATSFRNYLYDIGKRGSTEFTITTLSIGNLTVGGTGKTPHVEYLIRLLKNQYKIATLSRGYGRKTKGILIANSESNATTIGDEPYQYYHKYGNEITVAVGEERALAIPTILFEKEDTGIIVLDDAFQHRAVTPTLNILLSDYNRPFFKDHLLPYGRLRESRAGAQRADVIITTKCPDNLSNKEMETFIKEYTLYSKPNTPTFFSGIRYGQLKSVYSSTSELPTAKKVVLFSGIANAAPLVDYIKREYELIKHFNFPDHYSYKEIDIDNIFNAFKALNSLNDHILITTEKDMVKLLSPTFKKRLQDLPIYYIPIEIYFLKDEDQFTSIIQKSILQEIA